MLDSGSGRPCHQKALEQVLLSFFSDQELYRQGLRITTTLDKPLQDSLVASLATGSAPAGDVPGRVIVMREGTEVRAIACSGSEDQVRFHPGTQVAPIPAYEVATVPLGSIKKEEIIRTDAAPASGGHQRPERDDEPEGGLLKPQ